MDAQKKIIYNFLNSQPLATISTVNENGTPQSALIGFGEKEDLTLIIGTNKSTRKYKNILKNPRVALAIGFGNEMLTVQYEGVAELMPDHELESYQKLYYAKNPSAQKYESDAGQTYFKIIPRWIRYTDFNKEPEELFEITF
ncbi:MAG: pyridoxamine 5'-phosphate oxidase family protein [Patescibacteria group bacterium]